MDQIKKVFLFGIPVSICNFRCHYCYLAQRDEAFQGVHPEMKYSPEAFGKAMSFDRIGGHAYGNFCANGETLLVKKIDEYVKAFVKEGHYAEVVTNLSVTNVLDKFLSWDKNLLKHLEFKCSFHYLELKKKGLLDVFAANVKKVWEAGASATIEITPSDELVPYIEEVKAFSMEHFGALPHLTIARNDRTAAIEYLTNMTMDEYTRVWSEFGSDFWAFKQSIFRVKQKQFCYAGGWSMFIDLCSGEAHPCYFGESLGDVFRDPSQPLPEKPVGKCQLPHCYNGHALLTLGLIPGVTDVRYGDIRNRVCADGKQWLQPELKNFFNSQLVQTNQPYQKAKQYRYTLKSETHRLMHDKNIKYEIKTFPKRVVLRIVGEKQYNKIKNRIKGQ